MADTGDWNSNDLMEHLLMENGSSTTVSSSSITLSGSDMDLRPDQPPTQLYEIPPPAGGADLQSCDVTVPTTTNKSNSSFSFTRLHQELEQFSKMLEMDERETRRKKEIIQIIRESSERLFQSKFRRLEVNAFGGFSNGLATAQSDLDVVLTGMYSPPSFHNGGFSQSDKNEICRCLNKLLDYLDTRIRLENTVVISRARIPLLKFKTEDGIDVDISLGNDSGPRAARFIKSKVEEFPCVRPLVLALKCILKSNSLNDVATGGMGTYSLANMVIAFIQDRLKKQKDTRDYGHLFIEFLHFYGYQFYYKKMAVSLRSGAFCNKREVLDRDIRNREEDYTSFKICIEDYITGNDVSGGTFKMIQIVKLLRSAHDTLSPYENDCSTEAFSGDSEFLVLSKLSSIQCQFGLEASMCQKTVSEIPEEDPQRKKRRLSELASKRKNNSPKLTDRREERTRDETSSRRAPRSPTLSEVVATVFINCSSSRKREYRSRY